MEEAIPILQIVEEFNLEVLAGKEGLKKEVGVSDIKRPGIELAGFFDYFTPERIQILGKTELSFLSGLTKDKRDARLNKFMGYNKLPGVVITRGLNPPNELVNLAEENSIPLLSTKSSTTSFLSRLSEYLEIVFAPNITTHGVLVNVYGVGVLITGKSGIGKSETALGLVKRGHQLVADDVVKIKKLGKDRLLGSALKISQYYMELRGLGIIDIKTLFGAGAIKLKQEVELIIKLETWQKEKHYDRLGLNEDYEEILDVSISKLTVPVKPGRDLAMIIEVAAMNFRLKLTGYDAAQEFTKKLQNNLGKE
ncbi:HPr(Ser) kinase/phosphatase [Selenihalanaerobacter shriftii]|uniref:HPr kinase/phosphorylase n=1 Tax=Selenihalanaerobacter shriftii TaxID=142842 RepID=A0A1T4KI17_9FIRM|nr:HPr(Ser) kinase/phosphatase [Selenihalanaerobacter shriftii]SJZ42072.1 Hpr(Ser) kinase/phosphatase [Selenihalanaerobacter shriftii]